MAARLDGKTQHRIANVLTALGWHKSDTLIKGYRYWLKREVPALRLVHST
jgi:hypothetical protein